MTSTVVAVTEASQVGEARRMAASVARRVRLGDTEAGRLAIIVTEAATNLVKHAGGGEIVVRGLGHGESERPGVEVLALDRGPGIPNVAASLRDGHSTAGTTGTGLGAIRRQASMFDLYSVPGGGTALLARVVAARGPAEPPSPFAYGAVCVPKPGELRCGDAWAICPRADGVAVLVSDGLGHGAGAAEASEAAVAVFRKLTALRPAGALEIIHTALRPTRGAAVALTEIDLARGLVRFAGLGNIAGAIVTGATVRRMVSHNGTAGHEARRITEFTYPWGDGAVLVEHSDGLVTHWDVSRYPGLLERHPGLVAGVLYRDFQRRRDDVTVLVARARDPERPA
jgi:anti-sigma regulatory factor (Ser/Thr protein kinase)